MRRAPDDDEPYLLIQYGEAAQTRGRARVDRGSSSAGRVVHWISNAYSVYRNRKYSVSSDSRRARATNRSACSLT